MGHFDMRLFGDYGIHAIADGQFGSTGKGVLAAWLAARAVEQDIDFRACVSNAGPNSGHTFYHNGEKHVLKQLPTFAVAAHLLGMDMPVFLTAGAVIDPEILWAECARYPGVQVFVNNMASVITPEDKHSEADPAGSIAAVAGTRSGTGMAQANKIFLIAVVGKE